MNAGPQDRERGMILINVLIIVMLASAVLAIMLASEQDQVDRSLGLRAAAEAQAAARGAELSAIAALRRDLAKGDVSDTLRDEWANIGDAHAKIPGGEFSFVVGDAQSRFNLNNLTRGDAASRATFAQIAAAATLRLDLADRIAAMIALTGPIDDLAQLRSVGINDAELARLTQLCTALPKPTDVNVNTAPEPLLAIVFNNPASAHQIASLRAREGGVTPEILKSAAQLLPPGTGLKSDYFWSRGRVTMGDTSQQLTSLLLRQLTNGQPEVIAIRRWRGAAPVEAPPLPR